MRRDRTLVRRMLAVLLALLLPLAQLTAGAEQGTVVTSGGRLNMRKRPEPKAKLVTKIRNGSTVEVLEHLEGWYHISFEGKEGYVQEQFIHLLSEAVGREIYSNGATLYLLESPEADARIVGMVNAQQALTVERLSDEWVLVSSGGVRGYVRSQEINQLNEAPAAAAADKWSEGILKSQTVLFRKPDKKSEALSTWPKGTGVRVSAYNRDWSLVQVLDEDVCGFAKKSSIALSPMPTVPPEKQLVDESQYIAASSARAIAEKALRRYPGFSAGALICSQDTAFSTDGIRGPMFRFNYANKKGQYVYAAYVHAYTGEVLYTGDYSAFAAQQDASDLRTSPPRTTQEPQWWYDENGNVVWDRTPEPQQGTDIGQEAARLVADRYLRSKYPRFSQLVFSRVTCRHITDPTAGAGFQVPYYQFDYFLDDGVGDRHSERLAFEIIINAFTKEIEYSMADYLGEGNG